MRFARNYKYNDFPFCARCASHTSYAPAGKIFIDKRGHPIRGISDDATKKAFLICETCGSNMFKWADVMEQSWKKSNLYFKQFYSRNDLKEMDNSMYLAAFLIFGYAPLLFLVFALGHFGVLPKSREFGPPDDNIVFNTTAYSGPILFIYLLAIRVIRGTAEERQNKNIYVGKGVNGEDVYFDQLNGSIRYLHRDGSCEIDCY
jgi:hypothetical protein